MSKIINMNGKKVTSVPVAILSYLLSLISRLQELPDRALVHFRRRMGEVVVVSASIEGEWGKRGTRAEHIGRHTVQRSGDPGFRAGWLSWVVRHDVWKALYFTGRMMPWDGMVHAP